MSDSRLDRIEMVPQPIGEGDRAAIGPRGLSWVLFLLGLFAFYWRQGPAVGDALRLVLPDSDDMIRLVGVRDFLAGQNWFDLTQYRYLPPEGVPMHWSRLIDLPIAASIAGLTPVFGAEEAERVVVAGWPLLLFAVYCGLIAWGAWRLFGPRAAGLAVLVAGQMVIFSDLFAAGRIDHHNVQIILVAGAVICFGSSRDRGWAALASGALCGASLAVGLETLPFVACIVMAFALGWIVRGDSAARSFLCCAGGIASASAMTHLAQTAPSQWLIPACDALSPPWLFLTIGSAAAAAGLTLASRWLSSPARRLAAASLAGAAFLLAFGVLFPDCLHGPYAMVPEPVRSIWLGSIVEAFSFQRLLAVNANAALQAVVPLLVGAIAASAGAWSGHGKRRDLLWLLAAMLWIGVLLAQIQIRTIYIASAVLPLAAGWFLDVLLRAPGKSLARRVVSICGGILMFGVPWAIVFTIASPPQTGASLPQSAVACDDVRSIEALNTLQQGVLLADPHLGPPILLRTPHAIAAGSFHRAPAGIVAGIEAFSRNEEAVRRIVERAGVDYFVVCPNDVGTTPAGPEPFAKQLVEGRSVAWLQPVGLGGPLRIWRVVRDR